MEQDFDDFVHVLHLRMDLFCEHIFESLVSSLIANIYL